MPPLFSLAPSRRTTLLVCLLIVLLQLMALAPPHLPFLTPLPSVSPLCFEIQVIRLRFSMCVFELTCSFLCLPTLSLFDSALIREVHALNLLRAFISVSAQAAAQDIREAAARASRAVAAAAAAADQASGNALINVSTAPPAAAAAPTTVVGAVREHADLNDADRRVSDTRAIERVEQEEGDEETKGKETAILLPLAVYSLCLAINKISSPTFTIRNASNSLLVAAVKRIAGTDDEASEHKRALTPELLFCCC